MNLDEKLRSRIKESAFGSEERTVLRSILGELARSQMCPSKGTSFISQMIRTNKDLLRKLRRHDQESKRIEYENEVLESLLQD